ncbi:MAG: hypothetical protein GY828_06495 [Candidatus Gracilibacteria bacterium]|nr:hypothetical protein [Candidatus Gracilibacteria bacterium]
MKEKYSLALGGGAARGFIHIGILQYTEEQNIEIGEVSGTSMGAIIAGLIALGKTSEEITIIAKEINYLKLIDLDLKKGLLKGKKVLKKLDEIFGDHTIQDAKIPLRIVATCVETGQKHIFSSGKISDAVRASLSLPGIFIPHKIGDFSYIDGGITCNLPMDVLEGKNIIGVSALKTMTGELSSRRKIFGIEFNKGFFNLNYQIMHRTIVLMMKQNEDHSYNVSKNNNSFLLSPDFGKLDYYSFDKIDDFVKLGYQEAKVKLTLII